MTVPSDWIVPDWPAPAGVQALVTTRCGGVSPPPWGATPRDAGGMNVGLGSGDERDRVLANRAVLRACLPAEPAWLRQVHGSHVVDADVRHAEPPQADASVAVAPAAVCAVMVADCLPVLLAEATGRAVGAAHAGWRGLAGGVLQNAVVRLRLRLQDPAADILAWLGPAIGPQRFEVGPEVRAAMEASLPQAAAAFVPACGDKYYADLFALARQALAQANVVHVSGGGLCTASNPERFYSYRRDGTTGRHVAVVWRSID
jgi:polyphenol oxidase